MFERVASTLLPGGRFAWNSFVFDPRVAAEHSGGWRDQNGVRHRVEHFPADARIEITVADRGTITVLGFNILGDGLRDLLDPRK